MCYKRKRFFKRDIESNMLLEFMNKETKEIERYLVNDMGVINSNMVRPHEDYALINENGKVLMVDMLNSDLSYGSLVLSKVYGILMYTQIKNKKVNLFSTKYRKLIYRKEVRFMSQDDCLRLLAKNLDEHIVII